MRRAAEQGMSEAEYDYAVMLLRGQGLNADMPKALDYLKIAANKGIAGAQNRLAHLIAEGERLDKNLVEAAKWRLLARENGIRDDVLDKLVGRLSRADAAAAEKAAHDWREKAALELQ